MSPDFISETFDNPALWAVLTALPLALLAGYVLTKNEIR